MTERNTRAVKIFLAQQNYKLDVITPEDDHIQVIAEGTLMIEFPFDVKGDIIGAVVKRKEKDPFSTGDTDHNYINVPISFYILSHNTWRRAWRR